MGKKKLKEEQEKDMRLVEKYDIWKERRMARIRRRTCPKGLTSANVILYLSESGAPFTIGQRN